MNEIQEQIQDLMHRIPVLRQDQLEEFLCRTRDYHTSKVRNAIRSAGKVGRLLVSRDGFVTTKEYLSMVAEWDNEPKLNEYSSCRLTALSPKQKFLDEIDCFWVVLDMWRHSQDFSVSTELFPIQFVKESDSCLIQVCRMHGRDELTLPLRLRSLPWPEEPWRERIQRIAVVDSPEAARLIPHTGFTFICCLNPKCPGNLQLVERRTGDAVWSVSQALL